MSNPYDAFIGRREFLKVSASAAISLCISHSLKADSRVKDPSGFTDAATVHNMLIVGQETVFLSHLPMFSAPNFDSPHRYLVILVVSLMKDGSDQRPVYASDRKKNPTTKIYTLNPDEFVLPDLVSTDAGKTVKSFKANVFRGHLEKPGKRLLLKGVDVSIKNIIHFRQFDPKATSPPKLEYVLFGKRNELFLAHFITRPPDFDQVISVSASDHSFTDQELSSGMHVVFERPNSISQRFSEKQQAVGKVSPAKGTATTLAVKFKSGSEFYFEEGELRVPAVFEQTAAERRAGFP